MNRPPPARRPAMARVGPGRRAVSEAVEDDCRVRAAFLHLEVEPRVHVHDGGLEPGVVLGTQQLEERPDVLAAAADPQHPLAGRFDDDRRIAVARLERVRRRLRRPAKVHPERVSV